MTSTASAELSGVYTASAELSGVHTASAELSGVHTASAGFLSHVRMVLSPCWRLLVRSSWGLLSHVAFHAVHVALASAVFDIVSFMRLLKFFNILNDDVNLMAALNCQTLYFYMWICAVAEILYCYIYMMVYVVCCVVFYQPLIYIFTFNPEWTICYYI